MKEASFSDWMIVGAFAAVSTLLLAFLDFASRNDSSDVAVVFAPWVKSGDAAARAADAGATLISEGRWPFIVIVRPNAGGYTAHAFGAGALAVVDPGGLYGCRSARGRST